MNNVWTYRVGLGSEETSERELGTLGFKFKKVVIEEVIREHIPETLGKPYKLNTSMRIDAPNFFSCSSLISYLYTFVGVWMPSLVVDKFFFSQEISKNELRFGDLVFSYNKNPTDRDYLRFKTVEYMPGKFATEDPVNHVGMFLGDGNIIHASGYWYRGAVLVEDLSLSPSFKKIVRYGRIVPGVKEARYSVEIPSNRPDIRKSEDLLREIKKSTNNAEKT